MKAMLTIILIESADYKYGFGSHLTFRIWGKEPSSSPSAIVPHRCRGGQFGEKNDYAKGYFWI